MLLRRLAPYPYPPISIVSRGVVLVGGGGACPPSRVLGRACGRAVSPKAVLARRARRLASSRTPSRVAAARCAQLEETAMSVAARRGTDEFDAL